MRETRSGMYEGLHVKCSCPILIKLEFSKQIFTKYSYIKFNENPSSGAEVFHADTQRHDQANSSFSQFCKCA